MTPKGTRALRFGLLALAVSVIAAVFWTLRQPTPSTSSRGPWAQTEPVQTTRMGQFVYRQVKEGRETFVIEAESMTGQQQEEVQLRGVTLRFHYVARGEPGTGTVTSDEATLQAAKQLAFFKGHVRVTTADGFELTTETLHYRGDRGIARTEDAAQFHRQNLSGSSTGLLYDSEEGRVVLKADAFLKIQGEKGKPDTEIRGSRAILLRQEGSLQFLDGATVTQSTSSLKSDRFVLFFDDEGQYVSRARAVDSVEIESAGEQPLPGAAPIPGGEGKRHLRAGVFDMVFRKDGSLQEAFGSRDAELVVEPSPKGPQERRSMKAKTLVFQFDEQGRATLVRGQKDAVLTLEDLRPQPTPPRVLSSQSFDATIDPATGEVATAEFTQDVSLMQGSQRATSEVATYSAKGSRLSFEKNPRLLDEAQGSELVARVIGIRTNGDVTARQGVRHVLGGRSKPKPGGGLMQGEGAVATCDPFQYDADTRSSRYKDNALLRSGRDEVRGQDIKIEEAADGKRTLTATGHVVSVLQPRDQATAKRQPGERPGAPVETRAMQMVYEEAKGQIHYTGEVEIRQGDIQTKSPEATLYLSDDGGEVKTLVAGEPIEVRQGERVATGRRGTYTPARETMELVGDDVTLKDASQEVRRGRSVTFHVGNDSVIIDGRDEMRPETKILRQSPVKQ
jgi:LPS export ABC transporter protein LptC/lipopolysaccharide transport protein LptA